AQEKTAAGTSAAAQRTSPANFFRPAQLGYRDFGAQVDILDDVEELDAFLHRALEGLAAGDEAGTASALVDDGGGNGFFEVIGAGGATAVDEASAAHVAVGDLIAGQVDGVVAGEIGVN